MVVHQQPASVTIDTAVRPTTGDNYLILFIVMTFLVLIVGGWPFLLCTIYYLIQCKLIDA